MKMFVNGVEFVNPPSIDIVFEVDVGGESIGPATIVVSGGRLTIRHDDSHALTITVRNGGCLELEGHGAVAYDLDASPAPLIAKEGE